MDFKEKAKVIHNSFYNYSLVEYINNKVKVIIICPKHGQFLQRPDNHLSGKGCQKCKGEKLSLNNSHNQFDIINKFKQIHSEKYDYSKVNYIGSNNKVVIICKIHGSFEQVPKDHLLGRGCIKCGHVQKANKRRKIPKNLKPLVDKIRVSISLSYKNKGFSKNTKTYKILGCDWQTFKNHLENNPYGFKITNSDMDLDHIVPISKSKTEEQLIKLNHYTNFQLLPKFYNRWVKIDNDYNKEEFEKWLKNNIHEL